MSALTRISRERQELEAHPALWGAVKPLPGVPPPFVGDDAAFEWVVTLHGPDSSPYAGGQFVLRVCFPGDYPTSPPDIRFQTRIYHCDVDSDGRIGLGLLQPEGWHPALTVDKLCAALFSLLAEPDPDGAMVPQVAAEYRTDRAAHDEKARAWTRQFAQGHLQPAAAEAVEVGHAVIQPPAPHSAASEKLEKKQPSPQQQPQQSSLLPPPPPPGLAQRLYRFFAEDRESAAEWRQADATVAERARMVAEAHAGEGAHVPYTTTLSH